MSPTPFDWLSLSASVATFVLGVFVSVILYSLGKRVDFRSRMRRAEELRGEVNALLKDWKGDVRDIILMNARRYEKDYDGGNDTNRHGSVMGRYELIGTRHDGVEAICEVVATWADADGRRTRKESKGAAKAPNVFRVGFVPFDYIEHVNPWGDEYRAEPILYVRFKGPGRSPFESYTFAETKGRRVRDGGRLHFFAMDDLGVERAGRFVGWLRFTWSRLRWTRMERKMKRQFDKAVIAPWPSDDQSQ